MPELPEVETVVRDLLDTDLVGRKIIDIRISWERTIENISARKFKSSVKGCRIVNVTRRAKYIVIELSSGQWLLIHLRMTGRVHIVSADTKREIHERVALVLNDGSELRFIDTRKFGRWTLLDDAQERLGKLGPEPLSAEFKPKHLFEILQSHHRKLKPLLLDQHVLAGLGNIYVDEAMWYAKVHPCSLSDTLTADESKALYTAIRKVLRKGIRSMGTSLGTGKGNFYSVAGRRGRNQDGLQVFRRDGEPCPRCDTIIDRMIVGQRSTHLCPKCQTDK
jgi:formamidopyrimidine-DNA glycosylase